MRVRLSPVLFMKRVMTLLEVPEGTKFNLLDQYGNARLGTYVKIAPIESKRIPGVTSNCVLLNEGIPVDEYSVDIDTKVMAYTKDEDD